MERAPSRAADEGMNEDPEPKKRVILYLSLLILSAREEKKERAFRTGIFYKIIILPALIIKSEQDRLKSGSVRELTYYYLRIQTTRKL